VRLFRVRYLPATRSYRGCWLQRLDYGFWLPALPGCTYLPAYLTPCLPVTVYRRLRGLVLRLLVLRLPRYTLPFTPPRLVCRSFAATPATAALPYGTLFYVYLHYLRLAAYVCYGPYLLIGSLIATTPRIVPHVACRSDYNTRCSAALPTHVLPTTLPGYFFTTPLRYARLILPHITIRDPLRTVILIPFYRIYATVTHRSDSTVHHRYLPLRSHCSCLPHVTTDLVTVVLPTPAVLRLRLFVRSFLPRLLPLALPSFTRITLDYVGYRLCLQLYLHCVYGLLPLRSTTGYLPFYRHVTAVPRIPPFVLPVTLVVRRLPFVYAFTRCYLLRITAPALVCYVTV